MRISDWSSDVCSSDLGRRWASSDDVAMVSTPEPAAYEAILRRGRSALAWEVLRRNPAYRAAYAALPVLPPTGVAADADFEEDLGPPFPCRTGPGECLRAADLVRGR